MRLEPTNIQQIGNELAIHWNDGTESFFELPFLRRACPRAACGGEPDVLGNIIAPNVRYSDNSFEPAGFDIVGGYGSEPPRGGRWDRERRWVPICREQRGGETYVSAARDHYSSRSDGEISTWPNRIRFRANGGGDSAGRSNVRKQRRPCAAIPLQTPSGTRFLENSQRPADMVRP